MERHATDPIEWLLARGAVTAEQVDVCRKAIEGTATPTSLLGALVARGFVDPLELAALGSLLPTPPARGNDTVSTPAPPGAVSECPTRADGDSTTLADAAPRGAGPSAGAFGHYQIQDELARGGMGVVYRAWDAALSRVVALKVLEGSTGPGDPRLARFLREARTAARLKHPRIVQVHDVGESGGRPYIVMDFVRGRTLRRRLQEGRVTFREGAGLLAQVAEGLAYAHEHGVVHRDVKPENLFLDEKGDANVGDFGLAVELGTSTRMTVSGQVLGTPAYMAPEQAEGDSARVGPAADVYGVGAVLYEVLTGRPPFQAATVVEVLYQLLHTEVTPPTKANRRVPRDLEVICLKCLERDPTRR